MALYYLPLRDEEFEKRFRDAYPIAFYVVQPDKAFMVFADGSKEPCSEWERPDSFREHEHELYREVAEAELRALFPWAARVLKLRLPKPGDDRPQTAGDAW